MVLVGNENAEVKVFLVVLQLEFDKTEVVTGVYAGSYMQDYLQYVRSRIKRSRSQRSLKIVVHFVKILIYKIQPTDFCTILTRMAI